MSQLGRRSLRHVRALWLCVGATLGGLVGLECSIIDVGLPAGALRAEHLGWTIAGVLAGSFAASVFWSRRDSAFWKMSWPQQAQLMLEAVRSHPRVTCLVVGATFAVAAPGWTGSAPSTVDAHAWTPAELVLFDSRFLAILPGAGLATALGPSRQAYGIMNLGNFAFYSSIAYAMHIAATLVRSRLGRPR